MPEYFTNKSSLNLSHPQKRPTSLRSHWDKDRDENCSRELDFLFWIVNGFIGVVILLGNSLTCAAFLRFENLRRSYMNQFLLSLAVCDILMAVLVTPGYAAFCVGCTYTLTEFCWMFEGGKDICFLASTFNLLAISYDRYLAMYHPLRYQTRMSRKTIAVILSAVWITPVSLASVRNIWSHAQPRDVVEEWNRIYSYFLLFIFVIVPIVIVSLINIAILVSVQKQKQKITVLNSKNDTGKHRRKQYLQIHKGTLSCVLVVITFVFCWIPRAFYYIFYLFNRPELVTPLLRKLSVTFLLFQSSTNPLIYSFYRREFGQALKILIKCQQNSPSSR
ncbi:D(1) dopamine receptor-like [Montipora foliosa]|uniref:D(1) dopamine receptor-like n=1 Tax=Montipora foliosa TaxID=591990 RepID=UPI0035F155B5